MIQNHRPYQLILSKTHSPLLSGTVARLAAFYGRAQLRLQQMRKGDTVLSSPADARASLQKIYPKPPHSEFFSPLPPQDGQVDLSIVIPSYNVVNYIDSCLQSILTQECRYRIQVIVVDGNSQDGTKEHLNAYRKDPRVILIEMNARSSAANSRNHGLLYATGTYLMFVDSDDKLAPGALNALMDAAQTTGADIVQGGWQYINEQDVPGHEQLYVEMTYTGKHLIDCFDLPGMPWGKVYRRSLFEKIRFPSSYTCFEDTIIHFLVFRSTQKIASVSALVYLWRKNPRGITASSQNRPAAVQSYWIMEELLMQDASLGLAHDVRFYSTLVMQLSNYCYATVSKMGEAVQRDIFALCCELYAHTVPSGIEVNSSYLVRCGAKALAEHRFDLWCRQGQLSRLL